MLYFIFGDDDFRSQRHFLEVRDFYKKQGASFFSGDFTDKLSSRWSVSELEDLFKSNTLFANGKLVVIKNLFQGTKSEFQKELLAFLREKKIDVSKNVMVLFYENGAVRSNALKKWLEQKSQRVKEFSLLQGRDLEDWVGKEAGQLGLQLTPSARRLLLAGFPADSGSLHYALEKLSLIKKGSVDEKTLAENVFLPLNGNIFSFLDRLAAGDANQALQLLEALLEQGTHPLYVLKMIVFQFRNLLIIQGASGKPLSMHPYVFQKLRPLAHAMDKDVLKHVFQRILYYDRRIKSGVIDGRMALEMFTVDFSKQKC